LRKTKLSSRGDLTALHEKLKGQWDPSRRRINVCLGGGCLACGAAGVFDAFTSELQELGLEKEVDLVRTGCQGFCERGTLVLIEPAGILYTVVTPADARTIIQKTVVDGKIVKRLLYSVPGDNGTKINRLATVEEIPFYKYQERRALRLNGLIDPTSINDYIRERGYLALAKVLFDKTPDQVIEETTQSGLRGRGGGGFPTGLKWKFCRASPGEKKYIICNADEGDPGAFMDRSLLEDNPHAVLEGMVIGAYAMGSDEGYIYVRAEYPLAIKRLRSAIVQMSRYGLLGENILGSGFNFTLHIKEGAGAFVCGEETALMSSIEGKRGMPRPRPPFPAAQGLFGKPTNINNVETWANVPQIVDRGPAWFASLGTSGSKGTKIFSLVGKVNNTGLVEVPMGMPLRRLIEDIGGGVQHGKKVKAVQTGGPSGGCLPAALFDLPIDYESLAQAGSIIGSGGLVVMDDATCMVDLARYFLTFTQSESCGKCTPCRLGTKRMLRILERICAGQGKPDDIDELETLAKTVKETSLCGLGQTAPNPVLTTLRYFRHEYEEHVHQKHCRAATCTQMVTAPCQHTCPAGVQAHRYVRLCSLGRFTDAYKVVRETLPLPSVCGTICFHPCETRCKRGGLDEPIAIRMLKGAAVRFGHRAEKGLTRPKKRTKKRVAVIGAGPAGLTAGYYLSKVGGHDVTIFEALPKPGGMLRYGIPRYRLSEKDLQRDVNIVRAAGVKIKTRSPVRSVDQLKKQGFDAIFVGLGAHASWDLGIPGARSKGVHDCVAFLRDVSGGKRPRLGDRVAVIGGGNSAIDTARTARRLGADHVTLVYRRTRDEMPADAMEIADALEEGVTLEPLTAPVRIRRRGDTVRVTCQRMELGELDSSGRRRPIPIEGSEFTEEYTAVLSAIGQFPLIPKKLGVEVGRGERITIGDGTLQTSAKGVFAGGDAVTGPASVIEAIAHGRQAAQEIDLYLGGTGDISEVLAPADNPEDYPPLKAETRARHRPTMRMLSPTTRVDTFGCVEQGYTKKDAIAEASRCLRCDLED